MRPAGKVRLDHMGMNVPDLEQAVAFFADAFDARVVFRLDRVRDPEGGSMQRIGADGLDEFEAVMLDLGGCRLELLQWFRAPNRDEDREQEAPASPAPADAGASHMGIEVAEVSVSLARLRSLPGVKVMGEPVTFTEGATPGLTNAFVRSPWGAVIELVNWGS